MDEVTKQVIESCAHSEKATEFALRKIATYQQYLALSITRDFMFGENGAIPSDLPATRRRALFSYERRARTSRHRSGNMISVATPSVTRSSTRASQPYPSSSSSFDTIEETNVQLQLPSTPPPTPPLVQVQWSSTPTLVSQRQGTPPLSL
jgi:hypothetical protein